MKDDVFNDICKSKNNWKIKKIKFLFSVNKGLTITKKDLVEDGLPVISYGQIHSKQNNGIKINSELLRYVPLDFQIDNESCKVKNNDFIFADTSEDYSGCGNCVYKNNDDLLYGGYHTIVLHALHDFTNKYLAYLFLTDLWRSQIRKNVFGVKVFSINQKNIKNALVLLPPKDEQERVVSFLDKKLSIIDSIIEKEQTVIDKLKEYKSSLITEVVTKGLNPNIEMRDSGIVWIGKIPLHWNFIPFQYLLRERNEKNDPIKTDERLSLSIDKGVTLYSEKTTNLDRFKDDVSLYKLAHKGDFVMNSMNMIVGAVGVSNYYGCVSPAYYVFRDDSEENLYSRYCDYFFHTKTILRVLFSMGKGIMAIVRGDERVNTCRLKVSRFDLNKLRIPTPPADEIKKILVFLDNKCLQIDKTIQDREALIEKLQEYKKSLIYEVVTGKREV